VITAHLRRRALERKGLQRILPKGGEWGLFGWHTVPPVPDKPKKKKGGVASNSSGDSNSTIRQTGCANHERILITEGEYDCLAAAQAISALPADHPLRGPARGVAPQRLLQSARGAVAAIGTVQAGVLVVG
jgi:hypothetical protein